MRVAIIGTRGIPNHYGGFEQCAEYLALGLVQKGFDVIVYNSHNHPFKESTWNGVKIIHCYDPEFKLGTAGQFVYDLNCILNLKKHEIDVVLQLGYTSSSIWGALIPKRMVVTTNMDGLEWKRTKYSKSVQRFLMLAESWAIRFSDHLISDSIGIQDYIKGKYNKDSDYIAYGANLFTDPSSEVLTEYSIEAFQYDILIARLEPENSIDIILEGVVKSNTKRPFLVIGKHNTKFGEFLKLKYKAYANICFIGGIYDIEKLNNLRYFSNVYFHGHTVGGTNPSLLEAMASNSLICANDNSFNKYILENDALYFSTSDDVAKALLTANKNAPDAKSMLENNSNKIKNEYSWDIIVEKYAEHIKRLIQ